MSILSKLCESASATVPFDQAKPIINYEERRNLSRSRDHQQLFEDREREIEREILGPPMIEGLDISKKPKRRRQEEVIEPTIKKSLIDEDTDSIKPRKSSSGLFSKICSLAESKVSGSELSEGDVWTPPAKTESVKKKKKKVKRAEK